MRKIKIETSKQVMPMIYAYTTPGISYHEGWTKIGYTERDVDARIKEQTQTAHIIYNKEWADIAIFADGKTWFRDKEFHTYLEKNNVERKDAENDSEGRPEWFRISGKDSHNKFEEFRQNKGVLQTLGILPYELRDEQKDAVSQTENYFTSKGTTDNSFLWNAKPRFGKTLATYDLCEKLNAKNILIVTNRPAIANSWYSDYVKFLGTESGYYFVSNVDALKGKPYVLSREDYVKKFDVLENCKGFIEFVSLQDLKGSMYFGGNYDKLQEVSELEWDILVIDEAHEGIDTYKTDVAFDRIKRKYTLHLSGTPFKALKNEKFKDGAIFNWTYADEQKRKREWKNSSEKENPYANLPQLNLFTYKMSDIVYEKVELGADFNNDGENEKYCFDLNEFFSTKSDGTFRYEDAVDKFLDALTKCEKFPFSTDELRSELNHTLWILKYVKSAKALAKKLKEHPVFKDYEIVVAAGDGRLESDEEFNNLNSQEKDKQTKKAYDKVVKAINEYDKTITLSVGQLTTGITIPEWTGVLMLSNMKSSALYVQASFRVQNPCMFNKKGNQYRKENAYVFDFDPARTLMIYEDFANGLNEKTANGAGDSSTRKTNVAELINFFPVYGEDENGEMVALDAEKVLSIPRVIHAKEVVRCGFMNDYLFQNIANVFNAPKEVIDILQKVKPATDDDMRFVVQNAKKDLDIDENGNVNIQQDEILNKANSLFGDKMYREIDNTLEMAIEEKINNSISTNDDTLENLLNIFNEKQAEPLIEKMKESYGKDLSRQDQDNVERKIRANTEMNTKKIYGNYQIENKKLEKQEEKEIREAVKQGNNEKINEIKQEYVGKRNENKKNFIENLKNSIPESTKRVGEIIVETIETENKNRQKDEIESGVKLHLKGFARTISSFLMAYGDENTTLETFDKIIPDNVFKEVTSISLDEFRCLRDGFDYIDETTNQSRHYNGFFDATVFNDSVKEFLHLKDKLADYFDEDMNEDIFDYIPPQKNNQIFTPKSVVKEMVDNLEKEDPGCFDNPNHTFVDLYMKSGLYIAEIVKRLFRSEKMKALYPNKEDRLNHIFQKQVYGCAPTEIIYRIVLSFVLGFSKEIKIEHHNLKLFDTLPIAIKGKNALESELDNVFGKVNVKFD